MFEFIVKKFLKIMIQNYFNELKIKGYELSIENDDKSYILKAVIPKTAIEEIVKNIKKGEKTND